MECATSFGSLQTPCIAFLVALTARALFSFLETSITALRLFKLKELAASAQQYVPLFQTLEKTPHRVLITILVANSLADVTTAALATHIMERLFAYFNWSGSMGFSAGIGLATFAILVFGEIIPKNIAKRSGERLFRSTLWITNVLFYTLYPLVTFLIHFSDACVAKVLGDKAPDSGSEWVSSEKEVQFLINYINKKGIIETEKTEMLQNIFDMGRTPIREICIPATDMVSVNVTSTIRDTLDIFVQYNFTRLPVYEGKIDNIIGMVHMKDIFALVSRGKDAELKEIIRPILYVPESIKVNQLLREFRQQHMHIAIVLNEHGSVTGLITLEDVLEEIVGEISDEHDLASENIIPLKQGGWLVKASTPLEELEKLLSMEFDTEEAQTIGGFLIEQLQHLPKKGERILYHGFYFQVQRATQRRVLHVLIFEEKTLGPALQDVNEDDYL